MVEEAAAGELLGFNRPVASSVNQPIGTALSSEKPCCTTIGTLASRETCRFDGLIQHCYNGSNSTNPLSALVVTRREP